MDPVSLHTPLLRFFQGPRQVNSWRPEHDLEGQRDDRQEEGGEGAGAVDGLHFEKQQEHPSKERNEYKPKSGDSLHHLFWIVF